MGRKKTMNKQNIILFGLITFSLLSMAIVSAFYPGETITIQHNLGTDKINWLIVDNVTEITILPEITFDLTNITIYFPSNMPPNSFKLVFIEEKTNEVIVEVPVNSGGGSSGGTRTIYKNNTITEYKYLTSESCEQTECNPIETQVEKIVNLEISKPFYKSLWFYLSMLLAIILIIGILWK